MRASGQQAFVAKYSYSASADNHVMLGYAANKGSAGCILGISDGDHTCMQIINADATDDLLAMAEQCLRQYFPGSQRRVSREEDSWDGDEFAEESSILFDDEE